MHSSPIASSKLRCFILFWNLLYFYFFILCAIFFQFYYFISWTRYFINCIFYLLLFFYLIYIFIYWMKFCFTVISIFINNLRIKFIVHIFTIIKLEIFLFLKIQQCIHIFLIYNINFFLILYFINIFSFFYLFLIDLNMILLRTRLMIVSLREFGLFNVILRKLLINVLIRV